MLISEKLQEEKRYSASEQLIIDYLFKVGPAIRGQTTKAIAAATHTSPSTLIRLAKKAGFEGWNALRDAYLAELTYLESHFCAVDANTPFAAGESTAAITQKIAALTKETVDDTLALLDPVVLDEAVDIIARAASIQLVTTSNNLLISQDFKVNMAKIRKTVDISMMEADLIFNACNADKDVCALIISYSGENATALKAARIYKRRRIPIIAITSIGENSLAKLADCRLDMTTREKLYSKIANFSTNTSIRYLLDVLFSCYFARNYDDNLAYRIKIAQFVEASRKSSSSIINEEES